MGYQFFDQYTLLHFSVGIIAYYLGINFYAWLILNILFEVIENSPPGLKLINKISIWPGGKDYPDNGANAFSDVIFCMLGWLVAQKLDPGPRLKS